MVQLQYHFMRWQAMSKKAVFTGTFDPFTNGHLNIVERGLLLFDHITIAVSYNEKKNTLFSLEERIALVQHSVKHLQQVSVMAHLGGLSVDLAEQLDAIALLKGMRSTSDMHYEQSMAHYGKRANPSIETVVLFTDEQLALVSSSGVKEFYRTGGDISQMVHPFVLQALQQKIVKETVTYSNEY